MPGPLEIVDDGRSGLLVPPDDAPSLAGALVDLLDDPDRARRMGEAGRERARERFGLERLVSEMAELFMGVYNDAHSRDI